MRDEGRNRVCMLLGQRTSAGRRGVAPGKQLAPAVLALRWGQAAQRGCGVGEEEAATGAPGERDNEFEERREGACQQAWLQESKWEMKNRGCGVLRGY